MASKMRHGSFSSIFSPHSRILLDDFNQYVMAGVRADVCTPMCSLDVQGSELNRGNATPIRRSSAPVSLGPDD